MMELLSVITKLCKIIEMQSKSRFNDIKTIADSWKCVSKLAESTNSIQQCVWIDHAMEILCLQINSTLDDLVKHKYSFTFPHFFYSLKKITINFI